MLGLHDKGTGHQHVLLRRWNTVTRISGLFTAAAVATTLLVAAPPARFISKAALAGLLFVSAVRADFLRGVRNWQFGEWLAADRIFPEEEEFFSATLKAVRQARSLLGNGSGEPPHIVNEEEPLQYQIYMALGEHPMAAEGKPG
jgi:hypothetical protein